MADGAGPDQIVVRRDSEFKVMGKTGDTIFGPINNHLSTTTP